MSKDKMKNLLNEGTIRRFMKLAEIETLSDDFDLPSFLIVLISPNIFR